MASSSQQPSIRSHLGPVGEIVECRPCPEGVTDLWASSGLYLKPVAKVSITVSIPFVKGKEGSRVVSNSEVMTNIRKLVTPREFKNLKILKETNTFLRYLGEIEDKRDLAIFVSKLNGSFIQLKSFGSDAVFKLNAAEYDVIIPKQNDWVTHFSKMIGSNEDKPGLRPDTILLTGIPCAWFSNYHRDKQRAVKEFERKREKARKKRMMRNRRRQRGSPVSSSDQSQDEFASSTTDSDEEEANRKREQQKKILLQFQSGDYQNTEEGKTFLHTKNEVHQIYRVEKSKSKSKSTSKRKSKQKKRKRKHRSRRSDDSNSASRSRSRSRNDSSDSRSSSRSASSRSQSSSRSRSSSNNKEESKHNKIKTSNKKQIAGNSTKASKSGLQWKKNAFTAVEGENDDENEKENVGDVEPENGREENGAPEDEESKQKRIDQEARRQARREFRKRPWLNIPVPDKPEESIVRRVFELYGVVRRIEIPLLKQLDASDSNYKKRKRESNGIGVFNFDSFEAQCDAADVTTLKTFEVYIQYETYLGFTVAMNALRGKRLYYKDIDDRTYMNTYKVDFDGTGFLSQRKIQQRKLERFKELHKDEILKDKEKQSKILKYENRLGGRSGQMNSYGQEFSSRVKLPSHHKSSSKRRNEASSKDRRAENSKSRKRLSDDRAESEAKRERRDKVTFPMPKTLPRSVLYEMSQSRARKIPKELSLSMGPALPEPDKESPVEENEERQVVMCDPTEPKDTTGNKRKMASFLSDLDDISSEEDTPGLQTNTEIDRLLKEALKVRSTRKRRLVVLELLRRLELAKKARVQLVAKRKAQAVILVHAVFERVKNLETAILDRRVEALEEVRLKQIEEERALREEMARKEALRALRQQQKMQTKEVKMREKIVKRAMRKKDREDLEKREQLRKQIAAEAAASGNTGGPDNPVLKSTLIREARHSVRRHGFKPDKVGHQEDKVVGYTAPENYSNYVEYMKELRPNFVGSQIVTSFIPEETPSRGGPVKSQVIPTQCPVPKPLEEIIQSKQFETDSESSCDEDAHPTLSQVVTSSGTEPNPNRRRGVNIDDDSLYKVDGSIIPSSSKAVDDSKLNERANRTFTDADFKVPDLPLAYRDENKKKPVSTRKWKELEVPANRGPAAQAQVDESSGSSSESSDESSASSENDDDNFESVTPRIIDDVSNKLSEKPKTSASYINGNTVPKEPETEISTDSTAAVSDNKLLVEEENGLSEPVIADTEDGADDLSAQPSLIGTNTITPAKRRNAVMDNIMGSFNRRTRKPKSIKNDSTANQNDDSANDSLSEGEITQEDDEGRLNTSSEEEAGESSSDTESGETSSGSGSESESDAEIPGTSEQASTSAFHENLTGTAGSVAETSQNSDQLGEELTKDVISTNQNATPENEDQHAENTDQDKTTHLTDSNKTGINEPSQAADENLENSGQDNKLASTDDNRVDHGDSNELATDSQTLDSIENPSSTGDSVAVAVSDSEGENEASGDSEEGSSESESGSGSGSDEGESSEGETGSEDENDNDAEPETINDRT